MIPSNKHLYRPGERTLVSLCTQGLPTRYIHFVCDYVIIVSVLGGSKQPRGIQRFSYTERASANPSPYIYLTLVCISPSATSAKRARGHASANTQRDDFSPPSSPPYYFLPMAPFTNSTCSAIERAKTCHLQNLPQHALVLLPSMFRAPLPYRPSEYHRPRLFTLDGYKRLDLTGHTCD